MIVSWWTGMKELVAHSTGLVRTVPFGDGGSRDKEELSQKPSHSKSLGISRQMVRPP